MINYMISGSIKYLISSSLISSLIIFKRQIIYFNILRYLSVFDIIKHLKANDLNIVYKIRRILFAW